MPLQCVRSGVKLSGVEKDGFYSMRVFSYLVFSILPMFALASKYDSPYQLIYGYGEHSLFQAVGEVKVVDYCWNLYQEDWKVDEGGRNCSDTTAKLDSESNTSKVLKIQFPGDCSGYVKATAYCVYNEFKTNNTCTEFDLSITRDIDKNFFYLYPDSNHDDVDRCESIDNNEVDNLVISYPQANNTDDTSNPINCATSQQVVTLSNEQHNTSNITGQVVSNDSNNATAGECYTFEWDNALLVKKISVIGRYLTSTDDDNDRLIQLIDQGDVSAYYKYNDNGNLAKVNYPNITQMGVSDNPFNWIVTPP